MQGAQRIQFWIHSLYCEKYRHIDNKLNNGPYSMDYVVVDMVDAMDNTNHN